MRFERIKDHGHIDFEYAFSIYKGSFPEFEQRTRQDQEWVLSDDEYHFNVIKDQDNTVLGIVLTWETSEFTYVEHLAISKNLRGKNIGTCAIEMLKNNATKPIILEIDPPVDKVSIKRKHFYEKIGFVEKNIYHTHPPYRRGVNAHSLKIMSYPLIKDDEYNRFNDYLLKRVMMYCENTA